VSHGDHVALGHPRDGPKFSLQIEEELVRDGGDIWRTYTKLRDLGEGAGGKVYEVEHRERFAVKEIVKHAGALSMYGGPKYISRPDSEEERKEVDLLQKVRSFTGQYCSSTCCSDIFLDSLVICGILVHVVCPLKELNGWHPD
jgi:hypothetical protein